NTAAAPRVGEAPPEPPSGNTKLDAIGFERQWTLKQVPAPHHSRSKQRNAGKQQKTDPHARRASLFHRSEITGTSKKTKRLNNGPLILICALNSYDKGCRVCPRLFRSSDRSGAATGARRRLCQRRRRGFVPAIAVDKRRFSPDTGSSAVVRLLH